jgi:uncharacterized protein (UPF0276 family)
VSSAGIGLKARHYAELLQTQPSLGFLELHTENYMGEGGPPHRYLEALAERYPLSFHGVGLSLGGHEPLDPSWLRRWRTLLDRYAPALVSEHVAWSSFAGYAFHDLLPLPYSAETLDRLCQHIDQMQTQLGRQILIENPARYLDFHATEMSEAEFLVAAAQRSGCGLLLDLNNLYVSACNQGEDAFAALTQIPGPVVGEIHLAGHALQVIDGHEIRIDDHGSRVDEAVWDLYRAAIELIGPRPTLIEWDTDVPALASLLAEAQRADSVAGAAQNETLRHVAR